MQSIKSKDKKKNDASYEYYIHYEGINRRMDEWVARSRIEPTDIIIEDDNEQRKKRKLLNDDKKLEIHNENSEHEGMDPTSNFSRLKLFFIALLLIFVYTFKNRLIFSIFYYIRINWINY